MHHADISIIKSQLKPYVLITETAIELNVCSVTNYYIVIKSDFLRFK